MRLVKLIGSCLLGLSAITILVLCCIAHFDSQRLLAEAVENAKNCEVLLYNNKELIGSGVAVGMTVKGKKRVLLFTARHVAKLAHGYANQEGMYHISLKSTGQNDEWKTVSIPRAAFCWFDTNDIDELAALDLTAGLNYLYSKGINVSYLDFDDCSDVSKLLGLGISFDGFSMGDASAGVNIVSIVPNVDDNFILKHPSSALARPLISVEGMIVETNSEQKVGNVIHRVDVARIIGGTKHGHSGSPVFSIESTGPFSKGLKLIGITSFAIDNGRLCGIAKLDSLIQSIKDKEDYYPDKDDEYAFCISDDSREKVRYCDLWGEDLCVGMEIAAFNKGEWEFSVTRIDSDNAIHWYNLDTGVVMDDVSLPKDVNCYYRLPKIANVDLLDKRFPRMCSPDTQSVFISRYSIGANRISEYKRIVQQSSCAFLLSCDEFESAPVYFSTTCFQVCDRIYGMPIDLKHLTNVRFDVDKLSQDGTSLDKQKLKKLYRLLYGSSTETLPWYATLPFIRDWYYEGNPIIRCILIAIFVSITIHKLVRWLVVAVRWLKRLSVKRHKKQKI